MTDSLRWSVDELQARYTLEPELRDIFVEGAFDVEILSSGLGCGGRSFYQIDVVDLPAELLAMYGLTTGNKQRILALAKELESLTSEARVFCLADRDLDHWFGDVCSTDRLRWTKFCSIEGHFISLETIQELVILAGRARVTDPVKFSSSVFVVLKSLYALRLVDRQLDLKFKWIDLKKYLKRSGDEVFFDEHRYYMALLNKNASVAARADFEGALNIWREKLDGDIRLMARGHDFTGLLAWAIGEFSGQKEMAHQTTIERMLVLLAKRVPTLADELV